MIWMERTIAITVALQSLELFVIRETMRPGGIWDWKSVGEDFPQVYGLVLGYPNILVLIALRFFSALAFCFFRIGLSRSSWSYPRS